MKYVVKITETAVKTYDVIVDASSPEDAEVAAEPVNPPRGPWGKTTCSTQAVKQLDGPWCTIGCGFDGDIVSIFPRFGSVFSKDELAVLVQRIRTIAGDDSPAVTGRRVVFEISAALTSEQRTALTAPLKSKSVAEVLAGAKS